MTGSVRKRGATWTAYWWVTDADGKRVQRSKGGFKLKKDAQSHLTTVLAAIGDGTYTEVQDKTMTVAQFLRDHWLPAARTGATKSGAPRRASTVAQYEIAVEKWIIPHIGGVRLVALSPKQVESALTALAATGGKGGRPLSGRSCQLAHGVLKMALEYGVRAGYCQKNSASLVSRPGAKSREMACWTAGQAQAFLAAVANDALYAAWVLFLARGPRRGEVAGLRWADVDLEAGTLRITKTRVSIGGRVEESEPKTAAGRRTLHLDAGLVAVLRAHRKAQMQARMAAGPGWTETGYVFVREDGLPPHPEHFSDRFEVLCRRAGVPVIRLHDCRHTAVSLALADGTPVKVVQEMAGHSNPAITQGVYAHVMPGQHEAAGARLSGLLGLSG
ncbi:site-specific integrase [Pseudonocardia sp. 73-21]|uniref:site-specific integrase n=1 Tax=Pseudonocardia sp. 73-21 TaxID=1895809 RepID=UPI00096A01FC|nr:site-specific integrase [Pseudonocardia sp. 73-21]OJY40306.1 MAG: hypothetical protein BGP03_00375 [Pseudonocardia sp. 73-21]